MQVKNSIQLYTDLFVQALDDEDPRMRLAAVIAIAEASIENLTFQMKVSIEELASGGRKGTCSLSAQRNRCRTETVRSDENGDTACWPITR